MEWGKVCLTWESADVEEDGLEKGRRVVLVDEVRSPAGGGGFCKLDSGEGAARNGRS